MYYSSRLTDVVIDSLAKGFLDRDLIIEAIENNTSMVESYAFSDIRCSLRAITNNSRLLAYVNDKNVYYLPKDEEIKQAFIKFFKQLSVLSTSI